MPMRTFERYELSPAETGLIARVYVTARTGVGAPCNIKFVVPPGYVLTMWLSDGQWRGGPMHLVAADVLRSLEGWTDANRQALLDLWEGTTSLEKFRKVIRPVGS